MKKTSIKELKKMIRETVREQVATLREDNGAFKVGDIVVPNIGPHKGQKHKIIYVRDDGRYNIKPIGLGKGRVKYRLGAVGATADQLEKVEE